MKRIINRKRMQKLLLLAFCLLFGLVHAQSPLFTQVGVNRENSNITYNVLFADHVGMIWIGTSAGLYKYDGSDFSLYTVNKKDFENNVTAIAQDTDKTFWIGYKNGKIALLKNDSLAIFNPEEGLPKKAITSITADKKGIIWITTAGEGAYFRLNNRLYNINQDDGLNDNYTYTSAEDNAGNMWIGTDQGIAVCQADVKKKILKKFGYKDGLPDEIVRQLKKDIHGNIWIGTQDKGICEYSYINNKIEYPSPFMQWNFGQINSFVMDDNEFWIGTEENGVVNCNSKLFRFPRSYKESVNLNFNKIDNVLKDAEGNIWLAGSGGLFKTQGNALSFITEINKRRIKFIHAILSDQSNYVFFTPDQQLAKISFINDSVSLTDYLVTTPEKLIDIISLYRDKWGYIWIGTMGGGLFRLNVETGRITKMPPFASLENTGILSIDGNENEIWLATLGGVVKCTLGANSNTDNIQPIYSALKSQKTIGNYFVYKVFIDSKKRVWFGTDGRGITCYDNGTYTNYSKGTGISSDVVYSITEDGVGNTWFSTLDAGIYKFDGKKFTNYNLSNGLRELTVSALIYDKNGNIVMTHRTGIDVLNIASGSVHYFDMSQADEINPDLNAISLDEKGNVWIGTEQGIIRFNSHYKSMAATPRPFIESVLLLSDSSRLSQNRELRYDQNNISIDFTGLWYTAHERVKYQYMLEGYNKQWVVTKDKRIIFPGLPPGQYTFRLRCATGNDFTHSKEASFSFLIKKAVWNEVWFRVLMILLISSAAFYYLRLRDTNIRKFEALQREKIRFQLDTLKSQVNPHFLFNSFNTLISIIEKDKKIAVEYVENLSEFFRNVVNYRDKDLIELKEEIRLSSAYYFLQRKRFGSNLGMTVDIKEDKNELLIPPLVVQLLIENAIKHNAVSKETPLKILIYTKENKLIVSNNLNPKRSVETSTHTGLQNIIKRYTLLTTEKIEISKTEKEFIVCIPLIKNP